MLFRSGEVLVARTTDIGLSPLFLVSAAVVTEMGGPLSHAAVVAREYGVPAVVNVAGATIAIRTGETTYINPNLGSYSGNIYIGSISISGTGNIYIQAGV
mgnify:CR=1 FL=1